MISVLILLVLLVAVAWRLTTSFSRDAQLIMWAAVVVWTIGMFAAHAWALSHDPRGLVFDSSVDVIKYYNTAAEVKDYVSSEEIAVSSGSVWHQGYYYLNVAAMRVSDRPMLVLRLFKLTLFIGATLCLTRLWRSSFGERLAVFGFLFMTLGHWEFFYNNFRNFKDGVIASLVILVFVLLEATNLRECLCLPARFSGPAVRWSLLFITMACLFFLRSYLVIVLAASIAIGAFLESERLSLGRVIILVGLAIAGALLCARLGMANIAQEAAQSLFSGGPAGMAARIIKVMVAPIPWQHFRPILIPSHILYLLFFPIVVFHGICLLLRRRSMWQVVFVVSLFCSSSLLESSQYRKRLPLIPILVTWVLAANFKQRDARRKTEHYLLKPEGSLG